MTSTPSRFVLALGAVLVLCLAAGAALTTAGRAQQPETPPPLSLDDLAALNALIDEDTDNVVAEFDSGAVIDVTVLSAVLAFALFSFKKRSERLKMVSWVLSIGYLGFYKASLVSVVDIFGALRAQNIKDSQGFIRVLGVFLGGSGRVLVGF